MRLLPARDIGALHHFPAANAGIVDEDVDVLDAAVQRAESVRDAASSDTSIAIAVASRALGLDVGGGLLQLRLGSRGDDDVRAGLGECERNRAADAAAAAGDDDRPTHRPRRRHLACRV